MTIDCPIERRPRALAPATGLPSVMERDISSRLEPARDGIVVPRWLLDALCGPAFVTVGAFRFAARARLALEWALRAVESALSVELALPVTLRFESHDGTDQSDAAPAAPTAFAVRLRVASDDRSQSDDDARLTIALDSDAARALVDPLESRLSGLQRIGELTRAELGLLEYLALVTLRRTIARAAAPARSDDPGFDGCGLDAADANRLRVDAFLDEREASEAAAAGAISLDDALIVRVGVRAAGRSGRVAIALPRTLADGTLVLPSDARNEPLDPCPPHRAHADRAHADRAHADRAVTVRLALPPITLPCEQLATLAPGDVILLGATDLESFAAPCRLVTTTGWSLGTARIATDRALATSVRCAALDPRPHVEPPHRAEDRVVHALVGNRELSLAQLARWEADATIDLVKEGDAPVELIANGHRLGRGELVRVEGEVGVRVVELEVRR